MLKKLLVFALVAVVALAIVPRGVVAQDAAAFDCRTEEEVTVTVIAGTVGNELDAVKALADDFMALCPNITVEVTTRPQDSTETLGQYQQFFDAQSGEIDIYQIDVIWPGIFAEHLLDLNEYVSQETVDSFVASNIVNNTVDGRLVALPWFTGVGMLYYRTDLLEKYGLEVPQTWDELEAAATAIQEGERAAGNPDFWGFVFQGNAYEGLTCDALEWQASVGGGTILSPEGVIEVNNEPTINILDKVASWVGSISPDNVITFGEEDARGVWQAGNAAFMRNWGYAYPLGQADDSPIKDLFGVSPLPGGEAGMSAATLGGWQLAVSKYSENPDAAVAVVEYFSGYDAQVKYTLLRGEQPVSPAVYEDPQIQEQLPYISLFKTILEAAVARPSTVSGSGYGDVSQLYFTAVHSVLTGEADAATAMADLELQLADLGYELPE